MEAINSHDTLLNEQELMRLSCLFKLFGDPTRLKILYALLESELCVCAIAELLSMTQSAISHQLIVLKRGKLIKAKREGKTMVYSLADDHVKTIISMGFEHIHEGSGEHA